METVTELKLVEVPTGLTREEFFTWIDEAFAAILEQLNEDSAE